MAILNYTTQIDANKSIGEIQQILANMKVDTVNIKYIDGKPSGIEFTLKGLTFNLPARADKVLLVMQKTKTKNANKEQATRTAWRIIKDWVEAQMAIIQSEQSSVQEIFFPYLVSPKNNKTIFQEFEASGMKMLS